MAATMAAGPRRRAQARAWSRRGRVRVFEVIRPDRRRWAPPMEDGVLVRALAAGHISEDVACRTPDFVLFLNVDIDLVDLRAGSASAASRSSSRGRRPTPSAPAWAPWTASAASPPRHGIYEGGNARASRPRLRSSVACPSGRSLDDGAGKGDSISLCAQAGGARAGTEQETSSAGQR